MRLDSMPIVPWIGLHNTIVHGTTIVWIVASLPIFVSCWFASRMLMGDEVHEQAQRIASRFELSARATVERDKETEIKPMTAKLDPGIVASPIAPPHVVWDSLQAAQEAALIDRFQRAKAANTRNTAAESSMPDREANSADEVAQRAADIAAWAEELVGDELAMDRQSPSANDTNLTEAGAKDVSDDDRWLIETTMEVVRIAEQAVAAQSVQKSKNTDDKNELSGTVASSNRDDADPNARQHSRNGREEIQLCPQVETVRLTWIPIRAAKRRFGANRLRIATITVTWRRAALALHQESIVPRGALHYLLRHLKGIQEKAKNP